MAFTYVTDNQALTPAMVCDVCSSRVGADGFILGGVPIRAVTDGVAVVSVSEDGPASVFTACSDTCREVLLEVNRADVTSVAAVADYLTKLVADLDG